MQRQLLGRNNNENLHSTLYTFYTLHSTLYTLHYTLYTLHSTLYTLLYFLLAKKGFRVLGNNNPSLGVP